jgi:methylated-DNA-[protein]-cysteine S-methyltransferase
MPRTLLTIEPTPFQAKIYSLLLHVPEGRVTTYGALASVSGCKSAQAIGQALRKNPYAPQVPCHRVVRSDGCVGGFFGKSHQAAAEKKRLILAREGIEFEDDGRVKEIFILRRLPTSCFPSLLKPSIGPDVLPL